MVLELPKGRADSLSGTSLGSRPHNRLGHHRDAARDDVSHSRRLPGCDLHSLNQPGESCGNLPLRVPDRVAYLIGTLYIVFSIVISIGDPLTHFLWVATSLFASFFLLRIIADYGTAVPRGFAVLGAISLWDNTTVKCKHATGEHIMAGRCGRPRRSDDRCRVCLPPRASNHRPHRRHQDPHADDRKCL